MIDSTAQVPIITRDSALPLWISSMPSHMRSAGKTWPSHSWTAPWPATYGTRRKSFNLYQYWTNIAPLYRYRTWVRFRGRVEELRVLFRARSNLQAFALSVLVLHASTPPHESQQVPQRCVLHDDHHQLCGDTAEGHTVIRNTGLIFNWTEDSSCHGFS